MLSSLKTQALFWFASIIFVIITIYSFSFLYLLRNDFEDTIKSDLHDKAQEYIHDYKMNKDFLNVRKLPSNIDVKIYKNSLLVEQNNHFSMKSFVLDLSVHKPFGIYENKDDLTVDVAYLLKDQNYTIVVYKQNIYNHIENIEDILSFLNLFLFFGLFFIASRVINRVLHPIKQLSKNIRNITIDNFSKTLNEDNINDEMKELVTSVNEMINRLQKSINFIQRFNSDVSHELKMPVAVIKGEVELTLEQPRKRKEYVKSMQTIQYEIEQLQKIIENLLFLTKFSKKNISKSFVNCALDTILLDTINQYMLQAKEKNINIILKKIDSITLYSNQYLIHSIFSNLIDNALKYTPNDKYIYITLHQEKQAVFIIEDEGIGIAQDKLLQVTETFYRVDDSRNKKVKGFGLGLSIVKKYIELLDAGIEIQSTVDRGTSVKIMFSSDAEPSSTIEKR